MLPVDRVASTLVHRHRNPRLIVHRPTADPPPASDLVIIGAGHRPGNLGASMSGEVVALAAPTIRRLSIARFRGIAALTWRPVSGVNLILDGADVGKTTILDTIGLLLNPLNTSTKPSSEERDAAATDCWTQ